LKRKFRGRADDEDGGDDSDYSVFIKFLLD